MYDAKFDNKLMDILKVTQIRHPLGWTDKGEFSLLLRKGEKTYTYMLDTVPLEKEDSDKLIKLFKERDVLVL